MTFYPDLATTSFLGHGERLRAVGWLSPDHAFPRGKVSDEFLELLKGHVATAFQPMAFGGRHQCELCDRYQSSGNLWIPTPSFIYVAPEMIVHYHTAHGNQPPAEFCDALVACPTQGSPDYMRLLAPYFSYFRIRPPDALPTPQQQAGIGRMLTRVFEDIARLCGKGEADAAAALARACADIPSQMQGWGLWYRHIFSRNVRNARSRYPAIGTYLDEYNAVFGEDTDPELTAYTTAQTLRNKRGSNRVAGETQVSDRITVVLRQDFAWRR